MGGTEGAELRLFCLPYAGGSAVRIYQDWEQSLPGFVEVVCVELPGRGARFGELPYTHPEPLINELLRAILPRLDLPFAIFGHSLGGMLGFEIARRLEHDHASPPRWLFVSAFEAPDLPREPDLDHLLPDAAFRARIRELNGTPQEVLEDEGLMQLLYPVLRADFAVADAYSWRPGPPLGCPLTVFGGVDDAEVPPSTLEGWRRQTTGPFALRLLPGDHFFLHTAHDLLLDRLAADLSASRRAPAARASRYGGAGG